MPEGEDKKEKKGQNEKKLNSNENFQMKASTVF